MDLDSLKFFLPGRDRGPVLACYLDAFGLRGVLIAPEAGGDSLIGDWVVAETDLDAAIGVLADLVEKRVTEPLSGVHVISPYVVGAFIDLPVSSTAASDDESFAELVRWELDSIMAEDFGGWTLEEVLARLGYVSEKERKAIRESISLNDQTQFGDAAVGLDLVTVEQLAQGRTLLADLQEIDEELNCAWKPGGAGQFENSSTWAVSGIGRNRKRQIMKSFAACGLSVTQFYPWIAQSLLLLPRGVQDALVVDLTGQTGVCCRVAAGTCVSLQRFVCTSEDEDYDDAIAVIESEMGGDEVPIHYVAAESARICIDTIASRMPERSFIALQDSSESYGLSPLVAVGAHSPGTLLFPSVLAQPPPQPFYKTAVFRGWMTVAVIFLIFGVTEYQILSALNQNLTEEQIALARLEKTEVAREALEKESTLVDGAEATLAELNADILFRQKALETLSVEVTRREALIEGLFQNLQASILPGIIIEEIAENKDSSISVRGRSYSETSAQQFIEKFATRMSRFQFVLSGESVLARSAASSQAGYAFEFNLIESELQGG